MLLQIKDLKKHYTYKKGILGSQKGLIKSLDGVTLSIEQGETFSVVGESGSGKTTLSKTILKLIEPTDGTIIFDGEDITHADEKKMRQLRTNMQIVFQDPYGSLDPKWTIQRSLEEPLRTHMKSLSQQEMKQRVEHVLSVVGLNPEHAKRFPHELSGGQRQRVVIARALISEPRFIVLDEPVSALDVSIQAQILNLLKQLQKQLSLTYLFVSHDLSVVRYISDRVGVMYLGKMIEIAKTEELFQDPKHPYTKALLSAIPEINANNRKERIVLSGEIPSPRNPPAGCPFHTRCPLRKPECSKVVPEWTSISENHQVACHLFNQQKGE
ncbi:ABC transporter ATP-binding protein [Neobacillus mesonae]|uniref:ABC transporter ATP-binding protein n=1 Tax=Neobacillus mesonae TaxID=1193713 RepID=UPI00203A5D1B|nr:dipeptide ABC transporter ATP-binding protein [Neobacillus mesonae]MCM3568667.1 dipeptide ABC transporter ATP-binding protein [Neobacillus mesonae]